MRLEDRLAAVLGYDLDRALPSTAEIEMTQRVDILVGALIHIARGNISPSIDYARGVLDSLGIEWRQG